MAGFRGATALEIARNNGFREAVAEMVEQCAMGRWDTDPLQVATNPNCQLQNTALMYLSQEREKQSYLDPNQPLSPSAVHMSPSPLPQEIRSPSVLSNTSKAAEKKQGYLGLNHTELDGPLSDLAKKGDAQGVADALLCGYPPDGGERPLVDAVLLEEDECYQQARRTRHTR